MPEISAAPSALCLLCRSDPPSRKGEHVIPQWFFDRYFPPSEGPFTTQRNGKPELNRQGEVRTENSLTREFLAVCETCNQRLNRKFETRRPAVKAFYDGDPVDQVESVCRWLVKDGGATQPSRTAPSCARRFPHSGKPSNSWSR
jgi:hypothetical protein